MSHRNKTEKRLRRNLSGRTLIQRGDLELLEDRQYLAAHVLGSSTNYSTIQAAVDAATAGGTVTVDAGTYNEQVIVDKTLTIRGAKSGIDARTRSTSGETIIDGLSANGARTSSFNIMANDVTIDGFTISGETNKSTTNGAGIVISSGVAGTHLLNNIVQNNVAGVFLVNSSSTDAALIQHNLFQSNNNAGANGGRGIYTDGDITNGIITNVTIDGNTFNNNRGGSGTTGLEAAVAFEVGTAGKTSNIRITNNTFTNNGKSVLFFNSTGVLIQGNTATGAADWYSGSLRFEGNNHDVTIQYNTIYNNPGPGVAVDSSGTPGDSSGFVVTNNNIYNNGTNSTYKNRLGVVFNQTQYSGVFDARNNYWGNSSGPSGDGPGTGDGIYGNASKTVYWAYAKGGSELVSPFATSLIVINQTLPPIAPTGLTATVASTSQINLMWANNDTSQTSITIERSIDGTNFSPIASIAGSSEAYSDTTVAPSTTYYYRIYASNSIGSSPVSGVASATTLSADSTLVYLSDLPWVSATTGYDTVNKDLSVGGNPLTVGGVVYAKGIGTHAVSNIVYNLAGQYSRFTATVGLDDEEIGKGSGSVDFQVLGDGKVLFDSGILTTGGTPAQVDISVAGVQTLTLVATNGVPNNIDYDHSDWANAQLVGTALPSAPLNLKAVATSSSTIDLTWTPAGTNQTSFEIHRSSDGGINYTTVTTGIAASATSYTDSSLAASTIYHYRVRAVNSFGSSPSSVETKATTLAADDVLVYLSDIPWVSATTGYGTVNKDATVNGNPLTLNGVTYAKGIGTHALSNIVYNLGGQYTRFTATVGIDDEENIKGIGSVDFQVIGDGQVLFDSGVLHNGAAPANIDISVAGVKTLTLVATNGVTDDIDYDHSDWANAQLMGTSLPSAPANLTASSSSSSSIQLNWAATGSNQTGFAIDRSTDGTNFTTIATNIAANATSYTDSSNLTAGTKYYYQIRATNSFGASPNSNIANATTLAANATIVYLSDLPWVSGTTGYGSIQKDKSVNGNPLRLNGTTYAKGIGAHAVSNIVYNLGGQYTQFSATVGVDDEENATGIGSVDFQVIGDGKVLFDSGILHNGSATAQINISVAGVQTLTLVATNGVAGSIDYDHADWANAQLVGTPAVPAAPTGLAAAAAPSSSITLTWTPNGANQTGYAIDRSTDGTNFMPVATNVSANATTWTDPATLAPSTKYYYVIRATNSAGASANSNIASATTLPQGTVTYASDLTPTSATTGFGTIQKDASVKGTPITLNGVTYAKGIGAHAVSNITYNLAGNYKTFVSDVGVDDDTLGAGTGSVDFQVIGDGVVLYDSGILTTGGPAAHINISVAGVQNLTLVATNGVPGSIDYDHADWAGALLLS